METGLRPSAVEGNHVRPCNDKGHREGGNRISISDWFEMPAPTTNTQQHSVFWQAGLGDETSLSRSLVAAGWLYAFGKNIELG